MRRALRSLVAVLALAGCAGPKPAIFGGASTAARALAASETDPCRGSTEPSVDAMSPVLPSVEPSWGARIAKVEIEGAPHVPRDIVASAIKTKPGALLEQDAIARDVRALDALEAIDTARVDVDRLANEEVIVRFVLAERRTIEAVTYRGPNPLVAGHWVPLAKGELYDAARVARLRLDLERDLVDAGHLDASVEERHVLAGDKVKVCFIIDPRTKYVVDRFAFTGNDHVPQAELLALLHTHEHRVNEPGKPFRDDLLETDLLYVSALYYDRGYLSVKVGPARPRTSIVGGEGKITVEIPIVEGSMYRIRTLRFSGFGPAGEHAKRIGVKQGEVFNRSKVLEGIEKIRAFHQKNGIEVDVTPETALDPKGGAVDLVFRVEQVKK